MSFATHSENAEYIEALYEQYQRDPNSLPEEWQHFFRGFEFGFARSETESETESESADVSLQQSIEVTEGLLVLEGVQALVQAYRQMGHFVARLDPLGYDRLFWVGRRDGCTLNDLHEYRVARRGPTATQTVLGALPKDLQTIIRELPCSLRTLSFRRIIMGGAFPLGLHAPFSCVVPDSINLWYAHVQHSERHDHNYDHN